jgi:heme-degrading monooxygenase HmoA
MNETSDNIIAVLTIERYPLRGAYGALMRMGSDRLWLRRTAGLRFWKLLGSARGRTFGRWEPRRYATFTVWESAATFDDFERQSRLMTTRRRRAEELWTVRLIPVRWHGAWGGADPFAGARPFEPAEPGPWAILTRATIRPSRLRAFRAAAPAVDAALAGRAGLLASIGLGEAPLLTQATFSLWDTLGAMREFAYRGERHVEAMRRTREAGWYSEELFARFRPIASYGTWDGRDPLSGFALG